MAKKAKEPSMLDIPVAFGKVSIDTNTASIPVTADRSVLKVNVADKHLCGHRLTGKIVASDSAPDQGHLDGMDGVVGELESVFDVKGFGVRRKKISFSLSFSIADIKVEELAHFAKRHGRLAIDGVEELTEEDKEADDE